MSSNSASIFSSSLRFCFISFGCFMDIQRSRASSSVSDAPMLERAKHRLNLRYVSSSVVYNVLVLNPAPVVAAQILHYLSIRQFSPYLYFLHPEIHTNHKARCLNVLLNRVVHINNSTGLLSPNHYSLPKDQT